MWGAAPRKSRFVALLALAVVVVATAQSAQAAQQTASTGAIVDFNGDGKSDYAVFRGANGTWYAKDTATVNWGTSTDIPVPGDYNGDHKTDFAMFRPSSGAWYVKDIATVNWGVSTDIPVPGDYNGDGKTDFAVFRPSNGTWYVRDIATVSWGTAGDIPVPGDYNGDGKTDFAVYRPSNGTWYVRNIATVNWGLPTDVPAPGDYNGDGKTDFALYRPSNGTWYVKDIATVAWGTSGDVPLRDGVAEARSITSSPDTAPPSTPTNLQVTATTDTSITVNWSPSTDNVGVTGYGRYLNGQRTSTDTGTTFTWSGLPCGTSYRVGVDAVDGAGNRSGLVEVGASTGACGVSGGSGIRWRFAYSNRSDQGLMPQYGFNLIDVSTKSEADATPPGTQGQLWLYDYDNTTCSWEKDDTYIRNMVSSVADDPKVAGFYFSNEPDPFACPNAPQQHRDRNALIKSLAPTKYTLIGIDANWREHFDAYGTMWKGAADYVNYNPYICYVGAPCDFAWEDHVLQVAQSLGQPFFVALQAFKEGTEWRWPTAAEETQMLDRLKDPSLTNLAGYLTFSWDWQNDPLLNHPDVLGAIQNFNLGVSAPAVDTTAPTAPTGLAATASTATSVSLGWSAASDNVAVAGYGVYRNGTLVATTSGTSYQLSGLSCGTSYNFSVDAYDAAGNRSPQASLSAATGVCGDTVAPSAPTGLKASNATTTSVTVSWSAASDNVGVAGYGVYKGGSLAGSTSATSYTLGGLACGSSYSIGVDAYDAAGNRSQPTPLTVATSPCDTSAPTAPTLPTASGTTQTSITLSWGASLDNVAVAGYDVFRDGTKVGSVTGTSYTYTGLSCGTGYTLGVEAYDAAGNHSTRATLTAPTSSCPTTPPPSSSDPVIAAAGDICSSPTDCAPTATLLDQIGPDRVLTLGDNAYEDGTLAQYSSYYDPNWGRQKAKTSPAPGNHDYHTANGAGYFGYFGSQAPAPYYSFDLGSWHLISLNGEIDHSTGSTQETWLKNDLATHPAQCTLAYWHEPRFSSGAEHGSDTSFAPFWNDLYAAGAEIVLNGHDHEYERFAPQNPNASADPKGIREFVVGTGGASHYTFATPIANSEVRDNTSFGVLKLTLHPTSYDWNFIPIAGATFTDTGTTNCH